MVMILSVAEALRVGTSTAWRRVPSRRYTAASSAAEENQRQQKKAVVEDTAVVKKGLTHIKNNKYAPTPDEAATMTDEEFRKTIYLRMKEDERERRKNGPVGNKTSDDYLDSLSKKRE
jgi:hypothetical protein